MLDRALGIDNDDARHASEFEQLELLAELAKDLLIRIRDSRIGDLLFVPVIAQFLRGVWADGDDLGISIYEFRVILAQLRQMPAADWSPETAHQDENNMLLSCVVAEAAGDTVRIDIIELWGLCARGVGNHCTTEPYANPFCKRCSPT